MDANHISMLEVGNNDHMKVDHLDEEYVGSSSDNSSKTSENIYNTSLELISHADAPKGANVSCASSSCCPTAEHSREDDTYANDKSESKLVKRRKKKRSQWVLKFNCARLKNSSSSSGFSELEIADRVAPIEKHCICTGYRLCTDNHLNTSADEVPVFAATAASASVFSHHNTDDASSIPVPTVENKSIMEPVIDLTKFNTEGYPIEDCDERARLERAREIAEGVDPPPGFSPKPCKLPPQSTFSIDHLEVLLRSASSLSALSQIDVPKSVHTQIDYIHCLVPDLLQITSSSFYWGKIDRYEAEKLLENKAEGTFLLRDSAQEEYLFSVSFRKYGRSLHARIEQWSHRFSFDSHDPSVFSSPTVCGLIDHYKDPTCCIFFEPMLTTPLYRNSPFSLQHLCRAVICSYLTYDMISYLKLPKTLKAYLKEYHYKQRVKVRKFETEQ